MAANTGREGVMACLDATSSRSLKVILLLEHEFFSFCRQLENPQIF